MTATQPRPQTPAQNLVPIPAEIERPVALVPNFGGIPDELKHLQIWVCWRYQWSGRRWTKPPYIAMLGSEHKAKSNDPRTWRSFEQAKAAYLAGGYDGIGIMADGELVFGDFDHCLQDGQLSDFAQTYLPPTYAECSVGGDGAHFIALGTIERARKKPRGELYAKGSPRFLTVTGHRLADYPATIERCQDEINRFATALDNEPGSKRTDRIGTPRTSQREKSRKEIAAEIDEDERDEARQLYRTQGDRLERRFKAGAWKEETQWWCVARREYATFHARYPFVGLYDADGTFDPSQARMATGRAIRGLGFTRAEYAALMTHYFANDRAEMVARWGNKDTWWEELADIWNKSAPAKRGIWQPKPAVVKKHKPVGRASDHAAQVERVYVLMYEHRAGDTAIIKTADLAVEAGMHRVTLAGILAELRSQNRITTKRLGRYGGLLITFISDVVIVTNQDAELCATTQQIEQPTAAPIEDTHTHLVFLPESRDGDYISEQPTLQELAREYLSRPAPRVENALVDRETGEIKTHSKPEKPEYRRTARHFAACVGAYGYADDAARAAYKAEQDYIAELTRQEWQRLFKVFKAMPDDDLIAFIRTGRMSDVVDLDYAHIIRDAHYFKTRRQCAQRELGWRGLKMPAKPTKEKPITQQASDAVMVVNSTTITPVEPAVQALPNAYNPFRDVAKINAPKINVNARKFMYNIDADAALMVRDEDNL